MKNLWPVFLVFGLLMLPKCLPAQKNAPGGRWALGVGVGYAFNEIAAHDHGVSAEDVTYIPVETSLEFRFFRWVSLTANISYGQMEYGNVEVVSRNFHPFHQAYRLGLATASAGPKFQARIGQGDLEWELRLGMSRQWLTQDSYGPERVRYTFYYKGVNEAYLATRLGYTYWPKERFGICLALEVGDVSEDITDQSPHQLRNVSPEGGSGSPPAPVEALQATGSYAGMNVLWIGLRYRFKK